MTRAMLRRMNMRTWTRFMMILIRDLIELMVIMEIGMLMTATMTMLVLSWMASLA